MSTASVIVVGGGPGGYTAAFAAARSGASVTLVESSAIGGTCLNVGCIPTKAMKTSAEVLEMAHRLAEFGINGGGNAAVDMAAVIARKNRVREILRGGLEKTCASLKINYLRGSAELQGGGKVEVKLADGGNASVSGDHIILATGSHNINLPSLPVDHKRVITSDDALDLTDLPDHLLIVGGGVIGCELAFIYRAFGCKVTVVEGQSRLLPIPSVDADMSKLLQREAKKRGIACELGSTVEGVSVDDNGVTAIIGPSPFVDAKEARKNKIECRADTVLVCVGRSPNTAGLGLDKAGVAVDKRGWIIADEYMKTSAPGVYAIGDVLGPNKIMLAHVASTEGLCAVANIFGKKEAMDYNVVPSGIFTFPEIGVVGLSEAQAKDMGMEVRVNTFQMRELGKAQAMGELAGMFKLVSEAGSGRLLGVHIAGPHATDLIAEAALALRMKATAADVAGTIHAHPTLAEGLYEAALGLTQAHG